MVKKLLIISYHFYPGAAVGAKRPSELAATLRGTGLEVVVVTAKSKRYIRVDAALMDRTSNVEVKYVPVPLKAVDALWAFMKKLRHREPHDVPDVTNPSSVSVKSETFLGKIKRYFLSMQAVFDGNKLWCLLVCLRIGLLRFTRSFDLIISSGPPMSVHAVALFAKYIFGTKWIIDLRDPWATPERLIPNAHSNLTLMMETKMEEKSFRACDLIVCAAPGIERNLNERYRWARNKVSVVYNGFDRDVGTGTATATGQLAFLYLGNLYKNRNPFPLLEALKRLLAKPEVEREKVTFRLVGNCQQWAGVRLSEWITDEGIADRVKVSSPVSVQEIPNLMSQFNVLVNFSQGQPDQIPAKTFEYMAMGKEVLCIAEKGSDTSVLVRSSGMGRVIDPNDHERMVETLLELYEFYVVQNGIYTTKPVCDRYSRNAQNARYLELINRLL